MLKKDKKGKILENMVKNVYSFKYFEKRAVCDYCRQ